MSFLPNNQADKPCLLTVGIITYQDCKGLERCIDSLLLGSKGVVDRIFVVDGKYPEYEGNNDYSTDGTVELCQAYNDRLGYEIVEYHKLAARQIVKRNYYLKLAGQISNFLFVIDADEYVIPGANWHKFGQHLKTSVRFESGKHSGKGYVGLNGRRYAYPVYVHNIACRLTPTRTVSFAKLIYKPEELTYINHWNLYVARNMQPTSYQNTYDSNVVPGIVFSTDESCRPQSRLQQDIDYQWLLFKLEGEISEATYNNPKQKAIFASKIFAEMDIWQKYYEEQEQYLKSH